MNFSREGLIVTVRSDPQTTPNILDALEGPIVEAAVKWHYEKTAANLAGLDAATNFYVKEFEKQVRSALVGGSNAA
jgi:hypothetical protein